MYKQHNLTICDAEDWQILTGHHDFQKNYFSPVGTYNFWDHCTIGIKQTVNNSHDYNSITLNYF